VGNARSEKSGVIAHDFTCFAVRLGAEIPVMNAQLSACDALREILTMRRTDPERALEQLTLRTCELSARPDAKLLHAELVHELHGPAAAHAVLLRLVSAFPRYGSAHHLLGRVQGELGAGAAKRESFLIVHALDAVLDDALEERDVVELEQAMTRTAASALLVIPSWLRHRLAPTALRWLGRPSREQVLRGLDPRALAALEKVTSGSELGPASLQLVLYRTNLLASADDEVELRANLRAAVREVFERLA
jgi:hypothetical protein